MSLADRVAALGTDDKPLARRIVRARQARAQLAALAPRLDDLAEQVASAQERYDDARAEQDRLHKKRKALKFRLFASKLDKGVETTNTQYAVLQGVDAWKDLEAARAQLATARQEKMALDKDVQLLRAADPATQTRIAALLADLFDGPTPDFPEEDRLEDQVRDAQAAYDEAVAKGSSDADVAAAKEALADLQQQLKDLREKILDEVTSESL